jgi:FKBP-type peptidyl-prolyl cis-trans isomerase (trigger factor)
LTDEQSTTFEQTGPLAWQVRVQLDRQLVDAEVERRLRSLRRKSKLPGFRPGKAPMTMLRKRYGTLLRQQQIQQEAQTAVRRELASRGFSPIGSPELEIDPDEGSALAKFEVFPELQHIDLARLSIQRPVVSIDDDDVDKLLQRLPAEVVGGRSITPESEDLSTLREELATSMAEELEEALSEELSFRVETCLVAAVPELELPESLVESQLDRWSKTPGAAISKPQMEAETRRHLSTALVLAQAARQLDVRPDPTLLWKETERLADLAEDRQNEMDRLWANGEEIQAVEDALLRRRVATAILEVAQVIDAPMTFSEFASLRQQRTSPTMD